MYSIWISMTKNNVFFIKIHNHFGFSLEITIQVYGKYLIKFH